MRFVSTGKATWPQGYTELARVQSMSVGLYVLPARSRDGQSPHSEDEVYVVLAGRGSFTAGGQTRKVEPGATILVPAGVEHLFHDITAELRLVVVFALPEASQAGSAKPG